MNNGLMMVLAGNPNVGKSTIFNCLTGMHQHTGNWAGKTVANAKGTWKAEGMPDIQLTDAPGCYSLESSSPEEEVARECICDPDIKGVIVVCDGTCLERNLILALQVLEYRRDVILCINLMDRVRKKGMEIDTEKLGSLLNVPVITTCASQKKQIKSKLSRAVAELLQSSPLLDDKKDTARMSPEEIVEEAQKIAAAVTTQKSVEEDKTIKIDRLLTSPWTGFPAMGIMILVILWITLKGANYPSEFLSSRLLALEEPFFRGLAGIGLSAEFCEMTVYGMYRVLAWVVSVMLPPMAIFFPMFTLLEDWGFLPRVAFNLDRCFKGCKACGKQALTMCMGLGCNASAVVGCRIIDSRRERLLAMLTNSLVPCNGRFPLLIGIITMFFASESREKGALILTGVIMLGIAETFAATRLLSATVLRGTAASFTMELPEYRKPQFGKVIVRSVFDRTLFVLGRAAAVAAPAGMIIWIMANSFSGDISIIQRMAEFLDPVGRFMGMDGVILTAFILGIPANEIVLPIAMMIYMSMGTLGETGDLNYFADILCSNGWTEITAINVMIFSLMHWPCATTLLSVKKEAGGWRWAAAAFAVPLIMGVTVCSVTAAFYRIFL